MKYIAFILFMLTVPLANWLNQNIGATCIENGPCLVPVGFGLLAPSGVLAIGVALLLRDWLQELTNWKWSILAVVVGAVLSVWFSPLSLATASAIAYLISELADSLVYTKLRSTNLPAAVMASQLIGALIDSMIFVFIAYSSFQFSAGTTLGKLYAGAVVSLVIYARRK